MATLFLIQARASPIDEQNFIARFGESLARKLVPSGVTLNPVQRDDVTLDLGIRGLPMPIVMPISIGRNEMVD